MKVGRLAAVSVLITALTGCGDDNEPTAPVAATTTRPPLTAPPFTGTRITSPVTTAPASAGKLTKVGACQQFYNITADVRLTDDESAAAYSMLAQQTADPTLAAAIQRVADAFARHSQSISSAEVQALCR